MLLLVPYRMLGSTTLFLAGSAAFLLIARYATHRELPRPPLTADSEKGFASLVGPDQTLPAMSQPHSVLMDQFIVFGGAIDSAPNRSAIAPAD